MTARARRAVVDTVEASYRLAATRTEWLQGLVDASGPALQRGAGLMAWTFSAKGGSVRFTSAIVDDGRLPADEVKALFLSGSEGLEQADVAESFAHPRALEAASQSIARSVPGGDYPEALDRHFGELSARFGIVDCVACKAVDATGNGLILAAPSTEYHTIGDAETERWARVMAHALAGLRLGDALSGAELDDAHADAVLSPGAQVIHAKGAAHSAAARERLRAASRAIDRARTRAGRADPGRALEAWKGLVFGRWSLIDRFDSDGRRFLVARRNDPEVSGTGTLRRRQRQVLAYAALGHSNKEIAYALGLAPSTISSHLRTGMRAVGATSRADLARLFSANAEGEPQP